MKLFLTAEPAGLWENIRYGLSWFFGNLSPAVAFAVLGLGVCVAFFAYYWHCLKPRPHSLEWIAMSEAEAKPRSMTLTLKRHPFERRDWLPLLLVTAVYAATAFFRLGNVAGPQTYTVLQPEMSYSFSYDQAVMVDKLSYFTALGTGSYTLEYSLDGEHWDSIPMSQTYSQLLKWVVNDLNASEDEDTLPTGPITARYFRLAANKVERPEGLWIAELALWNDGQPLRPDYVADGGEALFDDFDQWADKATYMTSSYFD